MNARSARTSMVVARVLVIMVLVVGVSSCSSRSGVGPVLTSAPSSTSTGSSTGSSSVSSVSETSGSTPATSPPTVAYSLAPAVAAIGTISHGTLTVAGQQRTYRLYVPSNLPRGAVPLFIGLHGGTGWGDQFARTNHIEGLAESNGFIVVHPDGVKIGNGPGGVWNGGICCGVAARDNVDDVGFIKALVDQLAATYDIDPARTFAFGHSNGAIMSYRLACELSDRIAGIGMYAGALGVTTCNPPKPVSVLHIHGAADANIPLAGGVGSDAISGVSFPPPHDGFDVLAKVDGCGGTRTTVVGDITTELSGPCRDGTAAAFVTIATANHSWAGGTPIVTPVNGAGYAGYDATAAIVTFLLSHPRP